MDQAQDEKKPNWAALLQEFEVLRTNAGSHPLYEAQQQRSDELRMQILAQLTKDVQP